VGTIEDLVRDLRGFDANAEVAKALKKELAKPVPSVVEEIRVHAEAILPGGNGLGEWVAESNITGVVKLSGRTASVKLRASRNSLGGKSDLKAIDRGRVMAPSWGRRKRGQWHLQLVVPGWFTDAPADTREWVAAIDRGVDEALDVIRRG
jgi:hypothetical protein